MSVIPADRHRMLHGPRGQIWAFWVLVAEDRVDHWHFYSDGRVIMARSDSLGSSHVPGSMRQIAEGVATGA